MPRKKTTEEYIEECKDKEYDLPIEDYKGANTKINHKCKQGHIYEQTPTHHLRGQGCPICNGSFKKTLAQYLQECMDKEYDLPIENYKNTKIKIKHKCKYGHTYEQAPGTHLRGIGCPYCARNKRKTLEEYVKICKEKGYDLPIEDYKNDSTKIKHKCMYGHVYNQVPNTHLKGVGCPICSGNYSYMPKEYHNLCKEHGYDLPIEEYKNASTKIKHKCSKGHIYSQRPYSHLQGQGCPKCNESHGEKYIRNYLDANNIRYISEKRFDDCKDMRSLPFDFYLSDHNILIEYQGQQHFNNVDYFFRDESAFKDRKHKDYLKAKYAKDNGYKLLRPTYKTDTQEKINKYLDRYLLKEELDK